MELLDDEPSMIFDSLKIRPPWWRRRPTQVKIAAFCLCVGVLVTILSQAIWAAQEAARRSQCVCNLCGIKTALYNYESANGGLPPAFIADANGKPMHSWRVLILPFMEQQDLYNSYNFQEPWDGPNNRKLLDKMPAGFACPSRPHRGSGPRSLTSYFVITGPGTMFPGKPTTKFHDVKFADVKDGVANTLMVVESDSVDVPWTAPFDLDVRTMSLRINDPKRPGISSKHPGGANVVLGDSRTLFMTDKISPADLKALITIDGGEDIDVDAVFSIRPSIRERNGPPSNKTP